MAREVTEFITAADLDGLPDGTTYKRMSTTEQTKLGTVEDSATADQTEADIKTLFTWTTSPEDGAAADQTAAEIQTALLGQADVDIGFVTSTPLAGEKKIYGVHINAAGNIEADNEDTAV